MPKANKQNANTPTIAEELEHEHHHHHEDGEECGCGHEHHHHHEDGEECGCGHEHHHHHEHHHERKQVSADAVMKIYIIENLDCANCAAKIERKINELPGVEDATLTFATRWLSSAMRTAILEFNQTSEDYFISVQNYGPATTLAELDAGP